MCGGFRRARRAAWWLGAVQRRCDSGAVPDDTPSSGPGAADDGRPGEVRAPASIAVVAAAALYATQPDQLLAGPRLVVPVLEIGLLVLLVAANPRRMTRDNRRLRALSLALAGVIALANTVALVLLLHALVQGQAHKGPELLLAALQVWLTNIIAFGLIFWELDRGGPVTRSRADRDDLPVADFRFSQDENDGTVREVHISSAKVSDWRPHFVDYLYVSTTNSTAFSPTDTMPLSPRAKMLMSLQCIEALIVSVLVIARGVSLIQ